MERNLQHSGITSQIINAYYKVYNTLGYGFLEKVYLKSLLLELRKVGLRCSSQEFIKVYYEGSEVGFYIADIIVNECVIIEVKAAESLCLEHEAQLTNYLKATDIEVGLLLNFGKEAELKERYFRQSIKKGKIIFNPNNHKNPCSISSGFKKKNI